MRVTSTVPGYLALAGVVHARWNAQEHGTPLADWYDHQLRASGATESEIEAALRDAADLSVRWQKVQIGHGLSVDWRWREGATG